MKKIIGLSFLIVFLLPASFVFPWGGVNYWCPTHQAIISEAYKLLSKDPAFRGSGFLNFNSIFAHEGVDIRESYLDFTGHGPGPDAEGATLYSWHYYNPYTWKGFAPRAVRIH